MRKQDQKRTSKPVTGPLASKTPNTKVSTDLSDDELEKVSGGGSGEERPEETP